MDNNNIFVSPINIENVLMMPLPYLLVTFDFNYSMSSFEVKITYRKIDSV